MAEAAQRARKHVFVINGAPEFLNLMRELFQDEDYNVTTTNFVPNSFAQIAALQPDAIVLDIVLGDRDGWALLEQLHEEAATRGIPVLVVSTDPALLRRAEAQAARYGARTYLTKPFDLEAMLAAIAALIGPA